MVNKFLELINNAQHIIITSHVSPDPDSLCSILLLGRTLQKNFPDKDIVMHSEELVDNLNFIPHYSDIQSKPLADTALSSDLIIMVDAMNFGRCTRGDWQAISKAVKDKRIPVAIIDHHEPIDVEPNRVYINRKFPAATEEVYEVCFSDLKLEKPGDWAQITMFGLYSDTAGFTHLNDNYRQTLELLEELLETGIKLEEVKNQLNLYKLTDIEAIIEVLANIKQENNYTYSFIGDEFVSKWLNAGGDFNDLKLGIKFFMDNFVRNIEKNKWGFAVIKQVLAGENYYSVSFRSLSGGVDVAALSNKLGGGGHKGAAGAKIQASGLDEAINKVKDLIKALSL